VGGGITVLARVDARVHSREVETLRTEQRRFRRRRGRGRDRLSDRASRRVVVCRWSRSRRGRRGACKCDQSDRERENAAHHKSSKEQKLGPNDKAVPSSQFAVPSSRFRVASSQFPATGNPATGNRQPATGNRQPATGNRQ